MEREHLSPPLMEAFASITIAFDAIPEFTASPETRAIVQAVVSAALLFLESRIDPTQGVDPTVKYLYLTDGEPDPLEKDLQQDFMRFLRSSKFGTVDEWRGIGGGRADIVHYVKGVKFATEVKRETEDASFCNLVDSFGDQTALYQTTNIPIGILLVLDLTTRRGIADHIKKLYLPVVGDLFQDGMIRGVLIIRVPARRIIPSAATVAAKNSWSDQPRPRRGGRVRKKSGFGALAGQLDSADWYSQADAPNVSLGWTAVQSVTMRYEELLAFERRPHRQHKVGFRERINGN